MIHKIAKEGRLKAILPEWGTHLNEEIDQASVLQGAVVFWWPGCTGIWLKTHESTDISCDLQCGTEK